MIRGVLMEWDRLDSWGGGLGREMEEEEEE